MVHGQTARRHLRTVSRLPGADKSRTGEYTEPPVRPTEMVATGGAVHWPTHRRKRYA